MAASEAFLANSRTHLRFFRRNRLLLAVALIFLLFFGLSLVNSLFFETSGGHFSTLLEVSGSLNGMLRFLVPALGLLLIWSHLRERSLKMVLTKPCTPETWLASGLLTAIAISAGLHLAVFLITQGLSLAWGVPLQSGFAFVSLESFVSSVIALSYLSLLTMLFHPVVALLVLSILNEESLYGLKFMVDVGVKAYPGNVLFKALEKLCDALYYAVPTFHPFRDRFQAVFTSYRTTPEEWLFLAAGTGYAALAAVVLFLLSDLVLRRKPLM